MDLQIRRCLLLRRLQEAGKTQVELAEYLQVGQPMISKFAHKRKIMSLETAFNVAHFLGCSVHDLYELDNNRMK